MNYTRLTLILGALAAFGPLSIDMYLPGLPAIGREFAADTAAAQQTLAAFMIGLAGGQALYGPLADRYGRRRPLLGGLLLYTIASAGCALAGSLDGLVALRVLQALGGCAGMVIARSVVRDLFDAQGAARMFSLLMLVMGLAPITAPLIGGQLVVLLGWRAIFWLLAGFGLLCLALVALGLPETLPPARRAAGGAGAALRSYGRLLRDRRFVGLSLAGGFVGAGMFAYISGSPFVLIELYGVPPERYGLIFGLNAAGLIGASQLNRRLLDRYASEQIMLGALLAIVVAGLALVAAAAVGGLALLLPPLFVCIAGYGLVSPNAAAAAMAPYGAAAGAASALMGTLQLLVGAGASVLVGALHNGSAMPMAAVVAGCGMAGLLCYLALIGRAAPQSVQKLT